MGVEVCVVLKREKKDEVFVRVSNATSLDDEAHGRHLESKHLDLLLLTLLLLALLVGGVGFDRAGSRDATRLSRSVDGGGVAR